MAAGKAGAQTHSGQTNLEGVSSPRLDAASAAADDPYHTRPTPSPQLRALPSLGLAFVAAKTSISSTPVARLVDERLYSPSPKRIKGPACPPSSPFKTICAASSRPAKDGSVWRYIQYLSSLHLRGGISSRYDATLPPLGFIARPRLFPPPVHAASGAGHRLQIARELELHKP